MPTRLDRGKVAGRKGHKQRQVLASEQALSIEVNPHHIKDTALICKPMFFMAFNPVFIP